MRLVLELRPQIVAVLEAETAEKKISVPIVHREARGAVAISGHCR